MAYPARAVEVLVKARSAFLGVLAERQQQMADGPKWTVEVFFADEEVVRKGAHQTVSTAWNYAESYRKAGFVQRKLVEGGEASYVMYPLTSVLKMHCRQLGDFEEAESE